MSRKLDDLTSRFRPLAFELIARCAEAGIPVLVIDTLRTHKEQTQNIANGKSWTLNSKHLPQGLEEKAEAIDICPYAVFNLHGADKLQWDSKDPIWQKVGQIGESLDLIWGGRWPRRDMGHFELNTAKLGQSPSLGLL